MAARGRQGRFARSKHMAAGSWQVIRADRGLLRFPVQSFVVSLAVLVVAGAAIFGLFAPFLDDEDVPVLVIVGTVVIVVLTVLVLNAVVYLYAGGLVGAAHLRLRGEPGSYAEGMALARAQRGALYTWGLMNITVGVILSAVDDASDSIGSVASALGGMAWQVVSWLALPAIVIDGKGPIDALRSSAGLLRSTWGERLLVGAGFGLFALLAILPFLGLTLLGLVLSNGVLFLGGMVLMVLVFIAAQVLLSALSGVFKVALYHYATTGEYPPSFTHEAIDAAFVPA